jgi:hypothetical protein
VEPDTPRYEYRAWASFPELPQPDAEAWGEETYLIPLGLWSMDIKIRGEALEIKELVADRDGLQLWRPAARLALPVPALTLERELMTRIKIGQPLRRELYGRQEIMEDIVDARRNVAALTVRKRRRLFEFGGCRAETAEVEVAGGRLMTAAAEHAEPGLVVDAARGMGLDRHPNVAYVAALSQVLPRVDAAG